MDTATWKKIDDCLAEALELPAASRDEFLAVRLAGDPAAAAAARKLAAGAADAERMFSQSPVAKLNGLTAGSRVGPWELVKPLGSGGMGVVWMARRADGQTAMLAAIKLLPPALRGPMRDGGDLERRFQVEKQILARLQHPHIARLLDAGAGGGETPNFVMEFVDGQPLLDHLAARQTGRAARLRLFLQICDAVQYAHGNLVVHRDLKPHNILVSPDGAPKLLDFGIGKILNESAGDASITLHRAFSLDYASPEQIQGAPIGTATDIYSLGLILFETMTGERARRWDGKALGEVLALAGRFTLPAHPQMSGDLLAIARKAAAPEPAERYRTAGELAEDVERVLDGRPVNARPAGLWVHARSLARRNRLAMTAAAAALLAICGLGSWGWVSARQARAGQAAAQRQTQLLQASLVRERVALDSETAARQAAEARRREAQQQAELARNFAALAQTRERQAEERLRTMLRIFDRSIHAARHEVATLPGGTRMSVTLIERTLAQLREVKPSPAGRPDYLAVQAEGFGWLAELYGGANSNLGDTEAALRHRRRSVALWSELNALRPRQLDWERSLLDARLRLYLALPQAVRFDDANPQREWLQFEREFIELAARAPRHAGVLRSIGNYYFLRATRAKAKGEGASRDFERALQWFSKNLDESKPESLRDVALVHKYLAGSQSAEGPDRLHHAQEALRLDRLRAEGNPLDVTTKMDMSFSLSTVSDSVFANGDRAAAQKGYLEAYQIRKSIAAADPENAFVVRSLAYPVRHYGKLSAYLKDWSALAAAVTEFAWIATRTGFKLDPLDAAQIPYWQGLLSERSGDRATACRHYLEAAGLSKAVEEDLKAKATACQTQTEP